VRTVSKREVGELTVSGGKIRKLTETPKPPPKIDIPDHRTQLANLEQRSDYNRARTEEVALEAAGELVEQRKVLQHLAGELHGLKHELATRQHPPQMTVRRNQFTGFIDTVSVGRLTFAFKRNRVGSVQTIDILTTK